jgi:hypothetical protein
MPAPKKKITPAGGSSRPVKQGRMTASETSAAAKSYKPTKVTLKEAQQNVVRKKSIASAESKRAGIALKDYNSMQAKRAAGGTAAMPRGKKEVLAGLGYAESRDKAAAALRGYGSGIKTAARLKAQEAKTKKTK